MWKAPSGPWAEPRVLKPTGTGRLRHRSVRLLQRVPPPPKALRFAFRPCLPGTRAQKIRSSAVHVPLNVPDLSGKLGRGAEIDLKKQTQKNTHKTQPSIYKTCISYVLNHWLKYLLSFFSFHPRHCYYVGNKKANILQCFISCVEHKWYNWQTQPFSQYLGIKLHWIFPVFLKPY